MTKKNPAAKLFDVMNRGPDFERRVTEMADMAGVPTDIAMVSIEMTESGLPPTFVKEVTEFACRAEGAADLMELWHDAVDNQAERDAIVDDLLGHLEDEMAYPERTHEET